VLNLCTNAWQALPDGRGRVEIRLEAAEFEKDAPEGLPPGRYVHIAVRDEGKGMDAATRARIFEPFFTTKLPGQGTGLGLAVVHGIVTSHGGAIGVESELGVGTCFDIWLPALDPLPEARPSGEEGLPAQAPLRSGHGERVLYVDDDDVMRLMVYQLLQMLGYQPVCVADPYAAIESVQLAPAEAPGIDAVVTDYNMPGMNGIELASTLRQLAPGIPVLMSSGFVHEDLEAKAITAGVREVIRKQNTLEELGPALLRVIGVRPNSAEAAASK
jgi:CheY-like chemotaxis protein